MFEEKVKENTKKYIFKIKHFFLKRKAFVEKIHIENRKTSNTNFNKYLRTKIQFSQVYFHQNSRTKEKKKKCFSMTIAWVSLAAGQGATHRRHRLSGIIWSWLTSTQPLHSRITPWRALLLYYAVILRLREISPVLLIVLIRRGF